MEAIRLGICSILSGDVVFSIRSGDEMNESGLEREQEWLYWQVFEILHNLYNNVPTDFNEFVPWLDGMMGENNEQ